jgi:hypothetical protein
MDWDMKMRKLTKAELIHAIKIAISLLDRALDALDFGQETEGAEELALAETRNLILPALRILGSDDPRHWPRTARFHE